jgi:hypothetical protein
MSIGNVVDVTPAMIINQFYVTVHLKNMKIIF